MGEKINCWIWICSSCLARYLCKYLVHLTTLSILWPESFSTPCILRICLMTWCSCCVAFSLSFFRWWKMCEFVPAPNCSRTVIGKKLSRVSRSFYDQFRMINLTMPSQYHVNPWKRLIELAWLEGLESGCLFLSLSWYAQLRDIGSCKWILLPSNQSGPF